MARINRDFIPVALKAALVNNPPGGAEGRLYAEIGRSKPAPQGICTVNSSGKALAWALSFDSDRSILDFLDHARERYREAPDATEPVTTERYMRFPSRRLDDVRDTRQALPIGPRHADGERCPVTPSPSQGTLVGRVIGRALDEEGEPVADTLRQEHYMEARFELPPAIQSALAAAARKAEGEPFAVPETFAEALVEPAYLGQLDVNPLGKVPGSRNHRRSLRFTARRIQSPGPGVLLRLTGESDVEGGPDRRGFRTDGRDWEHRVTLRWRGFVELDGDRVAKLAVLARGDERLRWNSPQFQLLQEADVRHLMAGHPIDLDSGVRYGLRAAAGDEREAAGGDRRGPARSGQPPGR